MYHIQFLNLPLPKQLDEGGEEEAEAEEEEEEEEALPEVNICFLYCL